MSLEQCTNIKFCIFLNKPPSEMLKMPKKAYRNNAMKINISVRVAKHFPECHIKFGLDKSQEKVVLKPFFRYKDIIHCKLIHEG